jgi:hypothetical protein
MKMSSIINFISIEFKRELIRLIFIQIAIKTFVVRRRIVPGWWLETIEHWAGDRRSNV